MAFVLFCFSLGTANAGLTKKFDQEGNCYIAWSSWTQDQRDNVRFTKIIKPYSSAKFNLFVSTKYLGRTTDKKGLDINLIINNVSVSPRVINSKDESKALDSSSDIRIYTYSMVMDIEPFITQIEEAKTVEIDIQTGEPHTLIMPKDSLDGWKFVIRTKSEDINPGE